MDKFKTKNEDTDVTVQRQLRAKENETSNRRDDVGITGRTLYNKRGRTRLSIPVSLPGLLWKRTKG